MARWAIGDVQGCCAELNELLARLRFNAEREVLLVHAGLVPQWDAPQAAGLAGEVARSLQRDPRALLESMYGDKPDQWDESLRGVERQRFVINVLTRIRVCTAQGRIDRRQRGAPADAKAPWQPWFAHRARASAATRVIFGHWSALGFYRGKGLLGIDTGCVWGGALTAVNLDDPEAPPLAVPAHSKPGRAAPQE